MQPSESTASGELSRAALRIVLFGMPDAGKSSLLGALAQAAQTQEHVLNGHLTDLSHGLAELQRRLYEDSPKETLEEVVPYPVAFEPFTPAGEAPGNGRLEAVLVDCDGRVANDLVARRRSLNGSGAGSLAQAILDADTLVLVVDASAPPAQVESDFAEFGRFLRLFRHGRGQRTEVGGLPVFLVLTKCDLLAHPGDTPGAWMERIEERKRQVGQRFQEFLAGQAARGPFPFGSIDLHLWATAVKRPALAGSLPRPRDPYGVAELFRQCLEYAARFHDRERKSGRRLFWTVVATAGALAGLVTLAAGFLMHQPQATSPLQDRVENYRLREGQQSPSDWLRGALPRKLSELREIQNSPDFNQLPPEDQAYIRERLQELQAYLEYRDKLLRIHLADVHTEAELSRIEARLKGELALPARYAQAWAQTEAAQLRDQLLKDIQVLRVAVAEALEWYRRQTGQGEQLRTFAGNVPSGAPSWESWLKQVNTLVAGAFPHPETEEIPGSNTLTYATVLGFDPVAEARQDWVAAQDRLKRLRDMVAALGLAGKLPDGRRQPLDIPEPFALAQARSHFQLLEELYPRLPKELSAKELPDAVAGEVRRTAQVSDAHLIATGRQVILERLRQAAPDGLETIERWRGLHPWLSGAEELRPLRTLATLLRRYQERDAADPVSVLVEFLGRDHFDVQLQDLKLEVPLDRKLRPVGPLTVYHGAGPTGTPQPFAFKVLDEEGKRDARRRVTVYDFLRESTTVVYRPGDLFYATLPVKKDSDPGDWVLTWARGRSEMYQFERLVRPPRLHRRDQENTQGELMETMGLLVTPEGGIPKVPDLIPVVKLK